MNLSRDFARRHDEAIMNAAAEVMDLFTLTPRDKLLMQRKFPTTNWAFAVWRPTWSFCS